MKFFSFCILLINLWLIINVNGQLTPNIQNRPIQNNARVVCHYNSTSFLREGLGKMALTDLEPSLNFCTHLVYGYAGIDETTFKLKSLNPDLDLDHGKGYYRTVTGLKSRFPQVKFLLGVGGNADPDRLKYLNLLESNNGRIAFINSVHAMLKTYNFDGLDLAWEFPPNKPKKIHSAIGSIWKKFKKIFTGDFIIDEKAAEHKEEFVALVRDLKNSFGQTPYTLSLTVLPNTNSSLFYDVPALVDNLDFITLAAFDFETPERQPLQADYPAPIYELFERHPEHNVEFQVNYWMKNRCPPSKLNLGIPTYGRVWRMTSDSGTTGVPPVPETSSDVAAGPQSLSPGLYSWPEVWSKLPNALNAHMKGENEPLRKVNDPTKRFGSYAYRLPNSDGEHGLWVAFEDPDTASNKASYARSKGLGGIAIFDLSYDDFRGENTGEKYPILRAAKYKLMY